MASLRSDGDGSAALREIREELADIKHGLSNTQVELQILEEEYKTREVSGKKYSGIPSDPKIAGIEKKISYLSSHANQTTQSLNDCNAKIAELQKSIDDQNTLLAELIRLKSSLTALTSSMQKSAAEERIHKVKAGDSLEKIARTYKISIANLQEENNLQNTKIIIGQELKIPSSTSP